MGNKTGTAINLDRLALLGADTGHESEAGRFAGAVNRAVSGGEVDLPWVFEDIHAEVMESIEVDDRNESLDDVVPFALELAETISAESQASA